MSNLKQLLFLLHLPPPVHGSSVIGLTIRKSLLINDSFNCRYINLLASSKIQETGKVSFIKIIAFVAIWFRLLIEILKKKPDACYLALTTTGLAFYRDVFLIVLLKLFKINRVYHLHNKGISQHQHKLFNRICYGFAFKDANVILLSKRLYSDIRVFVPKSKVYICPNGIHDEVIDLGRNKANAGNVSKNVTEHKIQNSNKTIEILFLSNLNKTKGVFVLLDACAKLKEKKMPFKCVFVGCETDITSASFNKRVQELTLSDHVVYQGEKYGAEKFKAISETDIFVFPTCFEAFGLVNLEVMQQSKPVVSTFEGGIPDIVEDKVTGFLVPTQDSSALAEKIELLIKNPELRYQMGAAGRKKYEQEFTLEIFEHKITEILHQVLEKGPMSQSL